MPETVTPDRITFLMVGCQRCGTTWVDAALREHPEIYLPPQKQTYFFDRHYDKGIEWYLGQFAGAGPQHRAVGEIATGYCLPGAVERMARHLPHIRLIMTVRHPVDRAYSNYKTRIAETGWKSFEQAIDADPDLLVRGRYIEQIEALLRHYPRQRLLVLLYEDLDRDDRAYLGAILGFLGLEPSFECSQYGQRRNAVMFPRARRVLQKVGLRPALLALSRSPVGAAVRRINKRRGKVTSSDMDPQTRARLLEHFRPFNDRLAAWLGRDLSAWND
jgi:hypothetical protein